MFQRGIPMTLRKFAAAPLDLALLVVLICVAKGANSQAQTAVSGMGAPGTVWGTDHLNLEVTADGATLTFDCATGSIANSIATDARGNFRVKGTFTRESPGPVMRDANTAAAAAIYSGSIKGDTMHLTIIAGAQNENVGDYVLVRGKPGRVMKCR
jgi:hypothetical protein